MAMILSTPGRKDPGLVSQLEELAQQREGFQKSGNKNGEATTLANIASTHLQLADLREASAAAVAARELSKKSKDTEGELRELLLAGHIHAALGEAEQAKACARDGLALCVKARETKFADAARSAVDGLAAVASAMDGFALSAEEAAASAGALCALSHTQLAFGNFQAALPAAKVSFDLYEASGERRGVAAAALALAQAHVQAGIAEDRSRQKMFLPPATRHAAAAAFAADRAQEICSSVGAQEGVAAAQAILNMERVRACFHMRKMYQFSYDTWSRVNP